jgi:hypothetical protein
LGRFGSQKEYFATVEYNTTMVTANYPLRIRKQVKVLENQLLHPDNLPKVNQSQSFNGVEPNAIFQAPCSTCNSEVSEKVFEVSIQDEENPRARIEIITSGESFFKDFMVRDGRRLVELIVLPNHHLSGLPARQVERRLSTKYRLSSASFVVAAMVLAIFCFDIAVQFLWGTDYVGSSDEVARTSSPFAYLLYALFASIPIPIVYTFLHGPIRGSLEEEYFQGLGSGEIIKAGHQEDDSSLSTWNTNSVLGFKMSVGSLSTMA